MSDPSTAPGSASSGSLRAPLDAARLAEDAHRLGLELTVVSEVDSTNAELVRQVRAEDGGAAGGLTGDRVAGDRVADDGSVGAGAAVDGPRRRTRGRVLVAESQTAGRGRLDRSWQSARGAGLIVSVLLRPEVPAARLGWLPMVVGTAIVTTLRRHCSVPAVLKWPNDVLVGGAKLAGILVELVPSRPRHGRLVPPATVIGFGLNVSATAAELPPRSTSLLLLGVPPARLDRSELLGAVLTALVDATDRWVDDAEAARLAYREVCDTFGRPVRVELPDGTSFQGTATGVDEHGRLLVDGRAFSAADVIHLR